MGGGEGEEREEGVGGHLSVSLRRARLTPPRCSSSAASREGREAKARASSAAGGGGPGGQAQAEGRRRPPGPPPAAALRPERLLSYMGADAGFCNGVSSPPFG